ncbi:hypothetical protein ACX3YD_01425 [Pseudomonas fluorescens group sp. PF-1]
MRTTDPNSSIPKPPPKDTASFHAPNIHPKQARASKNRKKSKNHLPINKHNDKMSPKAQTIYVLIFTSIAFTLIAIAIRALHNQKIATPYPSRKIPWHEFTGLSLFFPVSVLFLWATCLLSLAILTANYNIKFDSRAYKKICIYSFIIGVFLHWLSLFFGVSLE